MAFNLGSYFLAFSLFWLQTGLLISLAINGLYVLFISGEKVN